MFAQLISAFFYCFDYDFNRNLPQVYFCDRERVSGVLAVNYSRKKISSLNVSQVLNTPLLSLDKELTNSFNENFPQNVIWKNNSIRQTRTTKTKKRQNRPSVSSLC